MVGFLVDVLQLESPHFLIVFVRVEIDPRHPKSSKYLARIGVKGTPESLLDVWGFKH